jgi:hypothetical protein
MDVVIDGREALQESIYEENNVNSAKQTKQNTERQM